MSLTLVTKSAKDDKDTIRIKGGKMDLHLNVLTGKQGDYWVFLIPTANISGYGKTEKEAEDFLNIEVEVFCEDVMSMSNKERHKYLSSIGFNPETYSSKNFSKSYVDMDGKLQDFEPGTIAHRILATAS